MEKTFADVKKGDSLYIVYYDLNKDYQIGRCIVTGFHDWTYEYGDRYETYGTKSQTNIEYEFNNIKFSRDMEYEYNKTHFTDSPEFGEDYSTVFGDDYVETFISYDEAKEYIVSTLANLIKFKQEQIEKINMEIEKYSNNLNQYE